MGKFFLESGGRTICTTDSLEECIAIARKSIKEGGYKIFNEQRTLLAFRGNAGTGKGKPRGRKPKESSEEDSFEPIEDLPDLN